MTPDRTLQLLDQLAGRWSTEATHPAVPGVVVRGSADVEWLEGERFLIHRARNDHPDFPDSLSIIGFTERDRMDDTPDDQPLRMHYFDSRGVFRVYDVSIEESQWRFWREAPGFSQRFIGAISADGRTILGHSQVCRDDRRWEDDLAITYRR